MSKTTMVVRPHDPRRRWIGVLVALVVLGASGWGIWKLGRLDAGHDFRALSRENDALREDLSSARDRIDELRERVALMERSRDIDKQATEELRATVVQLQDKILELREEVTFYRDIVSPGDAQAGIRVQDLSLRRAGDDGSYYYKLVLIQALKHDRLVSGQVRITAEGQQNGEPTTLSLAQMIEGDRERLGFSFRYFQNLEGLLVFPEGFVPARLEVDVIPKGRGRSRVSRTFEWSVLSG